MTKIISGFPGIGKTYFYNYNVEVMDSDSTKFSWLKSGERNPEFPNNYIEHIKSMVGVCEVLLISSHKKVREALVENGIFFTLVYPNINLKEEYMKRYVERGSPETFLCYIEDMWEMFIGELEKQGGCRKIVLESGQFLSDVLGDIE